MSNPANEPISMQTHQLIQQLGDLSHHNILVLLGVITIAALGLRLLQIRFARQKALRIEREAKMSALLNHSNAQARMLEQVQARLQTLEAYVDLLNGKQQQLIANGSARKHRLQDAIEFAGHGLKGQEIARRAGVNGSEARLIGELYGVA